MKLRQIIFYVLLIVAGLIYFKSISLDSEDAGGSASLLNQKAPDFQLTLENGKKVELKDFSGKTILLHFWATWCPPCASEIPHLEELYKKLKNEPFDLVAVSLDEKKQDALLFKKDYAFTFPIYFDPQEKVAESYGTYRLPETYLIDKAGVVVKKFVGPQEWTDPKIIEKIQSVISKK